VAETYGQPLTLSLRTFSDAAGTVPADPTTVTLSILNPDATERIYTWTAATPGTDIQHPSTGVFTHTVNDEAGVYHFHWLGTGAVATSQDGSYTYLAKYQHDANVTVADLATYLGNAGINTAPLSTRAQFILDKARSLCESVVSPLPPGAEAVLLDVAERAFANPTTSSGLLTFDEGLGPYNDSTPGTVGRGLYLTQENRATLRRLSGGGGAFTIDTTPTGAGTSLPWWDTGVIGNNNSFDWYPA
jgi:hypothetical protein